MPEYTEITNITTYNQRMTQSAMDKAFFVDKIDAKIIVDYGCADGFLFSLIGHFFPEDTIFIGYDNDPNMVKLARERFKDNLENFYFFSNWSDLKNCISKINYNIHRDGINEVKTAVVLSSVLHELYEYLTVKDIDAFWKDIFDFDYVVIRDMIPSEKVDRPTDINDVRKVYRKFYGTKELTDFQNKWGSIENNKSLLHFLLKYKYVVPNWEREVKENYFPFYKEHLFCLFPDNFEIIYHEHYCLPYLKGQIMNDFGIEVKDSTHLKIIFKNKVCSQNLTTEKHD